VSTLLEYNFADWSASRLAGGLGRNETAAMFLERSQAWQQLFDPDTLQIRPKRADGSWLSPFDPAQNCPKPPCGEWGLGGPGYVEGSAWQYTFMVNHDIPRLVELMGGPARFSERLQTAFDKGYYNLNNEPDMAYPYLFTFVPGEAWRTQKQVDTMFDPDEDPVSYTRARMQLLPVKRRKNNFQEVELPWPDSVARREAKRCLRCDNRQHCQG
jgi:putative alpha-1,2-mannosidase